MLEKSVSIHKKVPIEIGSIWRIAVRSQAVQRDWTNLFRKWFLDDPQVWRQLLARKVTASLGCGSGIIIGLVVFRWVRSHSFYIINNDHFFSLFSVCTKVLDIDNIFAMVYFSSGKHGCWLTANQHVNGLLDRWDKSSINSCLHLGWLSNLKRSDVSKLIKSRNILANFLLVYWFSS